LLLAYPASADELANDARVNDAIHLLDQWLEARQAYEQIPGFSVSVVYDQELLWAKGYGKANIESNARATESTVYSICSITKLFTSVAVMRAMDEADVDLDTPIRDLLPWFAASRERSKNRQITVFDLLTHSAGYKLDIGRPPDDEPYLHNPTQADFRELVRLLMSAFGKLN
jgi:CubicO group peptidase (beta-lactamase class C family)